MTTLRPLPAAFLAALVLLAPMASSVLAAEGRGPSTPEERDYVLELVEMLESRPEAEEAADARKWLVVWLSSVPDLTVHFCLDPLGSPEELAGVPSDLQVQAAFSQAAYLIRHPEVDAKSPDVFVAGIEGVLRAYDALRSHGGVGRLAPLERLRKERAGGQLRQWVLPRLEKCF